MWQNDTITFLNDSTVNTYGSLKKTWTEGSTVVCDVQYISKEKVLKEWGFDDSNEYLQVFDRTLSSNWIEGKVVKYGDSNYWVKKVIKNMDKIGASNHIYIILSLALGITRA